MDGFDWYENDNGNHVMTDEYGQVAATVFRQNGKWHAVITKDDGTSALLMPKFESPEAGREAAETAVKQPGGVPIHRVRSGWQQAKNDYNGSPSFYLRTPSKTYTVRCAKSGAWYTNVTTPPDRWFRDHWDAMASVDAHLGEPAAKHEFDTLLDSMDWS